MNSLTALLFATAIVSIATFATLPEKEPDVATLPEKEPDQVKGPLKICTAEGLADGLEDAEGKEQAVVEVDGEVIADVDADAAEASQSNRVDGFFHKLGCYDNSPGAGGTFGGATCEMLECDGSLVVSQEANDEVAALVGVFCPLKCGKCDMFCKDQEIALQANSMFFGSPPSCESWIETASPCEALYVMACTEFSGNECSNAPIAKEEKPAKDELVEEKPAKEEPAKEEPAKEEPATKRPTTEEYVTKERVTQAPKPKKRSLAAKDQVMSSFKFKAKK